MSARPDRPIEADWLTLRRPADEAARDAGAGGLLDLLAGHLAGMEEVVVLDVGAGTGANHAYLNPRLPVTPRWVALDHDAQLLAHPGHGGAHRMLAGVAELPDVVAGLTRGPRTGVLVTCAALLDLLTTDDLALMAAAVADTGAALLCALTVTGQVSWEPADPADAPLAEAFDDHQQRGNRPGPEATGVLAGLLHDRGMVVHQAGTPWQLSAATHGPLLRRWLDERVDAAVEHRPGQAAELHEWHRRRRGQLDTGLLRAEVGHLDLLALPQASCG